LAEVVFQPHKYQAAVLKDQHDIILAIAGKRGGKSSVAAVKFITLITDNIQKGNEGDYLILGPTYGLLRNGTIPTLMKYWPRKLGVYRRSESRIELPNNHYVFILSADEPDRIEAFGILGAWLDEAGQFKQEAWDKVQQRFTIKPGFGSGKTIISTTPYGLPTSWLNKDLIERRHEMPWLSYHNWSTLENPFIDHTNILRSKVTMNAQVYLRDVGGVYTSIDGLIYPDFSRESDVVKPFTIPTHWPVFSGIDYGFTDPTVIHMWAKDPETATFYLIDEFYESKKSLRDYQDFLITYMGRVKQLLFDPSAVGIMSELQRLTKMNLVAADNDVDQGIARVTRLIKSGRLKIFNKCEKTILDMESYVYAEGKNKPAHNSSHGPDAMRYAFSKDLMGIYPELRRAARGEVENPLVDKDGVFHPPELSRSQIFDLKVKQLMTKEKEPSDAFEYAPTFDPYATVGD
jgi:PBSX family phage terminase large subunit